jgi:hypothetical protein
MAYGLDSSDVHYATLLYGFASEVTLTSELTAPSKHTAIQHCAFKASNSNLQSTALRSKPSPHWSVARLPFQTEIVNLNLVMLQYDCIDWIYLNDK